MDLTRFDRRILLALAIGAGLACQLLLGTSYLAAALDPLREEEGVPVAVVVMDVGVHGTELFDRLSQSSSPILWVKVDTLAQMQDGLAQKEYFGALVLPVNFSADLDSFASQTPRPARVEAWENPGSSTSGSLIAARAIELALDATRDTARDEALRSVQVGTTGLGALTVAQGRYLAQPVFVEHRQVNVVPQGGANGLAPTYLAMAAWIGGYIGAIALERFHPRTNLKALPRAGLVAGAALLQGGIATGIAIGIGLTVPDALQLALLIALGTWMAYALVCLFLDLLGLPGILPAFAVLALGLPASGALYPVGLLPELYQTLHDANPFTWLVEGFRTTLYAPGASDLSASMLSLAALALVCTGASLAWERFRPSRKPS